MTDRQTIKLNTIEVWCTVCQETYTLDQLDEVNTTYMVYSYFCVKHPGEIMNLATIDLRKGEAL